MAYFPGNIRAAEVLPEECLRPEIPWKVEVGGNAMRGRLALQSMAQLSMADIGPDRAILYFSLIGELSDTELRVLLSPPPPLHWLSWQSYSVYFRVGRNIGGEQKTLVIRDAHGVLFAYTNNPRLANWPSLELQVQPDTFCRDRYAASAAAQVRRVADEMGWQQLKPIPVDGFGRLYSYFPSAAGLRPGQEARILLDEEPYKIWLLGARYRGKNAADNGQIGEGPPGRLHYYIIRPQ